MANYTHDSTGKNTVITRVADNTQLTLTGQRELMFMREVAYAAADDALDYPAYLAKCDSICGTYFGQEGTNNG